MTENSTQTQSNAQICENKVILGLIEEITLYDAQGKSKKLLAKIDTGADSSSIDISLAGELMLGPITKTKSVVSSHGRSLRPVVPISLILGDQNVSGDFTLYNRTHMTFKVLIGRNILEKGFLIDPSQNSYAGMNRKDVTKLENTLAQDDEDESRE